jgi:alkylhydroperoxidase/carboxymuconolactone decarboxylase family protein YurZ
VRCLTRSGRGGESPRAETCPAFRTLLCLEWSTARAITAGATDDEIADVLLAIAPVVGLGRMVCAAPDVATALGYDLGAALEEPNDH